MKSDLPKRSSVTAPPSTPSTLPIGRSVLQFGRAGRRDGRRTRNPRSRSGAPGRVGRPPAGARGGSERLRAGARGKGRCPLGGGPGRPRPPPRGRVWGGEARGTGGCALGCAARITRARARVIRAARIHPARAVALHGSTLPGQGGYVQRGSGALWEARMHSARPRRIASPGRPPREAHGPVSSPPEDARTLDPSLETPDVPGVSWRPRPARAATRRPGRPIPSCNDLGARRRSPGGAVRTLGGTPPGAQSPGVWQTASTLLPSGSRTKAP